MNQEQYIESDRQLLTEIEAEIKATVAPLVEQTIQRLEALPDDAGEDDYERILGPLNDTLEEEIGGTMFLRQDQVSALALKFHPGKTPKVQSPKQMLERAVVGDESIASNFARRSPSKWMRNLFGQGRKQIEAQVSTLIASGVWAIAGDIQQMTWGDVERWRWITEEDELVCSQCGPLHNVVFDYAPRKAHHGCRCEVLPASPG